jgi:DNA gyrase inhibitor GyrI
MKREARRGATHRLPSHTEVCRVDHDTQTGMLPGYPESAICVQRFDDSLNSAIHTTYRNWLRSSSMHEPRDPPLEVVKGFVTSPTAYKPQPE